MKVTRTRQMLLAVASVTAVCLVTGSAAAAPGGGEEETLGNNLSMPIVFAEGYGLTGMPTQAYNAYPSATEDDGLRPRTNAEAMPFNEAGEPAPYLDPADAVVLDEITYYTQAGPSVWKAYVRDAVAVQKSLVYFGDNLTGHQWTTRTKIIHVETGLQRDFLAPVYGYPMTSLSGTQMNEVFGTTGVPTDTVTARIYTPLAHLVIKKLNKNHKAIGTLFSQAVYSGYGVDGEGGFVTEVTGSGALSYAYNWMLTDTGDFAKAGWWRIIFKLDESGTWTVGDTDVTVDRNSKIVGAVVAEETEGEGPQFPIVIDNPYKAHVDIQIK